MGTSSISMIMFLVNIEVSVVATALVSVVEDLDAEKGFGWVVTGYLVTYTSMFFFSFQVSPLYLLTSTDRANPNRFGFPGFFSQEWIDELALVRY